jgi:hypothetical protein
MTVTLRPRSLSSSATSSPDQSAADDRDVFAYRHVDAAQRTHPVELARDPAGLCQAHGAALQQAELAHGCAVATQQQTAQLIAVEDVALFAPGDFRRAPQRTRRDHDRLGLEVEDVLQRCGVAQPSVTGKRETASSRWRTSRPLGS